MNKLTLLPRFTVLITIVIVLTISILSSEISHAQSDTSQGIVRRTEVTTCMDACSHYYMQPDSGYQFTYLKGNLDQYVGLHVKAVGVRVWCVECGALEVSQVVVLPPTAVLSNDNQGPVSFYLLQNYPNPFNPTTTIEFSLPKESHVIIVVYDLLAREVIKLADDNLHAGAFRMTWNGTTIKGQHSSSGVYYYRLFATPLDGSEPSMQVKKMIFTK